MRHSPRKLRSPLKTFGGKSYSCRKIIGLMTDHGQYIEPFFGGGSVLLNKPRAYREVVGDLDAGLVDFWITLRDHGQELSQVLSTIPYTESAWIRWTTDPTTRDDPIDRAAAFLVRNRFSRVGMGKDFAWSERLRGKKRVGGPIPGDANAWDTIRETLPLIIERIQGVEFHCCPAIQLIDSCATPESLIYCDPPYVASTRSSPEIYTHEMDDQGHIDMIECLKRSPSLAMISGYANEIYDIHLEGWNKASWKIANHSSQSKDKQTRVENVWIRPAVTFN